MGVLESASSTRMLCGPCPMDHSFAMGIAQRIRGNAEILCRLGDSEVVPQLVHWVFSLILGQSCSTLSDRGASERQPPPTFHRFPKGSESGPSKDLRRSSRETRRAVRGRSRRSASIDGVLDHDGKAFRAPHLHSSDSRTKFSPHFVAHPNILPRHNLRSSDVYPVYLIAFHSCGDKVFRC